MSKLKEKN